MELLRAGFKSFKPRTSSSSTLAGAESELRGKEREGLEQADAVIEVDSSDENSSSLSHSSSSSGPSSPFSSEAEQEEVGDTRARKRNRADRPGQRHSRKRKDYRSRVDNHQKKKKKSSEKSEKKTKKNKKDKKDKKGKKEKDRKRGTKPPTKKRRERSPRKDAEEQDESGLEEGLAPWGHGEAARVRGGVDGVFEICVTGERDHHVFGVPDPSSVPFRFPRPPPSQLLCADALQKAKRWPRRSFAGHESHRSWGGAGDEDDAETGPSRYFGGSGDALAVRDVRRYRHRYVRLPPPVPSSARCQLHQHHHRRSRLDSSAAPARCR